jgi:hypothetical protein
MPETTNQEPAAPENGVHWSRTLRCPYCGAEQLDPDELFEHRVVQRTTCQNCNIPFEARVQTHYASHAVVDSQAEPYTVIGLYEDGQVVVDVIEVSSALPSKEKKLAAVLQAFYNNPATQTERTACAIAAVLPGMHHDALGEITNNVHALDAAEACQLAVKHGARS